MKAKKVRPVKISQGSKGSRPTRLLAHAEISLSGRSTELIGASGTKGLGSATRFALGILPECLPKPASLLAKRQRGAQKFSIFRTMPVNDGDAP